METPKISAPVDGLARIAVWVGLVLFGFSPLLLRFGGEQWSHPHYQFYPLMIVAAAFVGWQRVHGMPTGSRRPGSVAITYALLASSLLISLAAFLLWSGRAAAVGAFIALVAVFWRIGGWPILRALMPAGVLLLIVVGPPVGIGDQILQRLREIAVWASSRILVWLGVIHMETGTVLEIKGARLLVAEACSGINSMMAVLGFTLVLTFLRRRTFLHTVLLIASSVLFVLWANTVRIAGGVWLQANRDVDILSGTAHEGASLVLFSVCMALVMSADVFIQLVSSWVKRRANKKRRKSRRRDVAQPVSPEGALLAPSGPILTRGMWIAASLFAIVGIAQFGNAAVRGGIGAWVWGYGGGSLPTGAFFQLPETIAGWQHSPETEKLLAQPELEGKQSQSWVFTQGDITAIVAIDFPFAGYHDLTLCYRNAGWIVQDLQGRETTVGAFQTADLSRLSEKGYYWCGQLNEQGEWISPPRKGVMGRILDRLEHTGPPMWSAPAYQVQVWIQRYQPLTPAQQESVNMLFEGARTALAGQIMKQLQEAR